MSVLYINWVQILIDLICFFAPLFLLVAFAAKWNNDRSLDDNEENDNDNPQG